MALTLEQYSDLVEACDALPGSGREKRRAARLTSRAPAAIIPMVDNKPGSPVNVQIRDLSPRGVGLLCNSDLPSNTPFILRLPRKNADPIAMLCTVCHGRLVAGGSYLIGAEFVCIYSGPAAHDNTANVQRIVQKVLS